MLRFPRLRTRATYRIASCAPPPADQATGRMLREDKRVAIEKRLRAEAPINKARPPAKSKWERVEQQFKSSSGPSIVTAIGPLPTDS